MPTLATSQFAPPKSWDEFEELCADLFMREWGDPNAVRHGRQGQRQNGVDIYGQPVGRGHAGVQCKGKRLWPPTTLTKEEMDAEVANALGFRPHLNELTFATTALDDVDVQAHARAITKRHSKSGLFTVHVLGWGELTRRLAGYSELLEKYYGYTAIRSLKTEIAATPERTSTLIGANTIHFETKLFKRSDDGLNRFFFGTRTIPFVGREREFHALNQFLDSDRAVSWWLVAGAAGQGKSRLALELYLSRHGSWAVDSYPSIQTCGRLAYGRPRSPR